MSSSSSTPLSRRRHRSRHADQLFGYPRSLRDDVLPTKKEVYLHICELRFVLSESSGLNKNAIAKKTLADIAATDIKIVWEKARLPTVSHTRIEQRIFSDILDFYQKKKKSGKRHDASLVKAFDDLFDICACRCADFNQCSCSREKKVPRMERDFIIDQRRGVARRMKIGGVDVAESFRLQQNEARASSSRASSCSRTTASAAAIHCDDMSPFISTGTEGSSSSSSSTASFSSSSIAAQTQNRRRLLHLGRVCDRFKIGNYAASEIVNAHLLDLGLATSENLVTPSKIFRARRHSRKEALQEVRENFSRKVTGFYFDGRKDRETMTQEPRKQFIVEEHVVVVAEPESRFPGHVVPENGTGAAIANELLDFVRSFDSEEVVIVVGADGCAVNTGPERGVIATLERSLHRPLHWAICMLHLSELLFKNVFKNVDGGTVGNIGFSGPLGKTLLALQRNERLVSFEKVEGKVPILLPEIVADLSSDQKFLYKACQLVMTGEGELTTHFGSYHHARWLTLCNRVLWKYITTEVPSMTLKMLTSFVLNVYAPLWFRIKADSSVSQGARHFFFGMELVMSCPLLTQQCKRTCQKTLQTNAFYAHSEWILLAMLCHEDADIRAEGVAKVQTIRQNSQREEDVRSFKLPKLNFNAKSFVDLINWNLEIATEPPLTKALTTDELLAVRRDPLQVPQFPCHSQAVERNVKNMTEAASRVCGKAARDGILLNKAKSRQKVKRSKTDYIAENELQIKGC